jgi:hypothetical protein
MRLRFLFLFGVMATILGVIASCQSENEQLYNRYYTSGSLLYRTHCENCHGVNGEGLGNLIPSFRDSVYLKQNINKLPCFIKYGLGTPITVTGKLYNSKMPAQDNLTSIEVAEILTYVTNSFGNKLGLIDANKVNSNLAACN